jgi:hypothetical protein
MSGDAGEDEQRGQHGPRRDTTSPPSVLAGYGTYLVAIFVGVPLLVLCLSLTGVLVVHAFAGSRDLPDAIVVAAALALGGFLTVLGLVVRQRRWSARWRGARERLARELKGHLSRDVEPVRAWLDARWKGDYDPRDLWLSAYGFSIVFTTGGGRNALLVLDPIALRRGRGAELPAKLHVLIVAGDTETGSVPGQAACASGDAAGRLERIAAEGHAVTVSAAGVMVVGSQQLVRSLRERPERMASLEDVIDELIDLVPAWEPARAGA